MSPKFGLLGLEAKRGSVFLDGGFTAQKEYSEETAREIDQEVARIIHETYARVRILPSGATILERLARRLLDKEVRGGGRACAMLGASPATPQPDPTRARMILAAGPAVGCVHSQHICPSHWYLSSIARFSGISSSTCGGQVSARLPSTCTTAAQIRSWLGRGEHLGVEVAF